MTTYTIEEHPAVNGAVPMPIKKVTLELDEIGYPGWKCTLRTNPRSEVWDTFLSENDTEAIWNNFGKFILEWNFGDEDGNPLPLPPATRRADLPAEVPTYLLNHYIEAFNLAAGFPKAPSPSSEDTSPIRSESSDSDDAENAPT